MDAVETESNAEVAAIEAAVDWYRRSSFGLLILHFTLPARSREQAIAGPNPARVQPEISSRWLARW